MQWCWLQKSLTVLIDVYNGRNVYILANLIEIKIDMPDVIKFVRRKYKF